MPAPLTEPRFPATLTALRAEFPKVLGSVERLRFFASAFAVVSLRELFVFGLSLRSHVTRLEQAFRISNAHLVRSKSIANAPPK